MEVNFSHINAFLPGTLGTILKTLLLIVVTIGLTFLCRLFYNFILRRLPSRVNCWFCNLNTKVPYEDTNSWICPQCQQYNGFTSDGGYNKIIPEQHSLCLNSAYSSFKTAIKSALTTGNTEPSNGLCRICNINQELKVQQLANFSPMVEENYDEEIDIFRRQLEKSYGLCENCHFVVDKKLKDQQYNLLTSRLNQKLMETGNKKIVADNVPQFKDLKTLWLSCLKVTSSLKTYVTILINAVVLLMYVKEVEEKHGYFKYLTSLTFNFIPQFIHELLTAEGAQEFMEVFHNTSSEAFTFRSELSGLGFLTQLLSFYTEQRRSSLYYLIIWTLIYILTLTKLTALQCVVSVVGLVFGIQSLRNKTLYFYKKELNGNTTSIPPRPQTTWKNSENMYSEELMKPYEFKNTLKVTQPDLGSKNLDWRNPTEEGLSKLELNLEKKKTDATKLIPCEGVDAQSDTVSESGYQTRSKSLKSPEKTCQTTPVKKKKSRVFNKEFIASLEPDPVEEETQMRNRKTRYHSPPPELYANLNGLHLNTRDMDRKDTNFLFQSHNFIDQKKSKKGVLQPSKLLKNKKIGNWVSAGSWNDPKEDDSRSSTPSSGYSSQKLDKQTENCSVKSSPPNLFTQNYENKNGLPVLKTTPEESFDYYDRNRTPFFYPYNQNLLPNIPPNFPNNQQHFSTFGSPISHPTAYGYPTPQNYPFCPQNQKISPYDMLFPKYNFYNTSPKSCDTTPNSNIMDSWNGSEFSGPIVANNSPAHPGNVSGSPGFLPADKNIFLTSFAMNIIFFFVTIYFLCNHWFQVM